MTNITRCRVLAAVAAALGCTPVIADDALSESAFLNEVPVVLSVSRLAQRVDEAPAAVTVIDRQMIRDSGAWDLSEVFRLVPGMYVAYHAARFYSTDSIVSYHGLMSETMSHRMQVLVDGRSVYSPLYGGVIWSDIPVTLEDIDRIEVVRGPNAASYGANSFIGVINIITRHSADQQGTRVSFAGGRGRAEATAHQGGRNGDLTWYISASLRNDSGEDESIRNPTNPSYVWTKNKFDDKRIQRVNLRGDYQINLTDTLEIQLGYNGGSRQAGEVEDVHAPDKTANNYFTKLNWRRALEDGGELAVQYYDATESSKALLMDANLFRPPLPAERNNGDVIARRRDLEVQHTFSPRQDTRVVWGASTRRDTTFAPHDLGGGGLGVTVMPDLYETRAYNLSRLFGNVEWRPRPDLLFNLGAMTENNSYTGTDTTPRGAVNWHFLPGQTLRLSYSEATRTPSVFEKRWEEYQRQRTGNPLLPSLQPERVKATDIGWLGKFRDLDVDFRLFHERYTELIADHRNDAANRGNLNSGSATIKGFETQVKWNITPRTRLIYGLSHVVVDSPNVDRINYTNSVPTNNQSLMLTHSVDNHWRLSLIGYQTGENHFSRTDYDPNQNRGWFIPTQRRWDARVAYNFLYGKTRGEASLNVQNLTDAQYYEFRHDNQVPGRIAWFNLRLEMD